MSKKLLSLIAMLVLAGCQQMCSGDRMAMTPEQVVETYLSESLNMTTLADKETLLALTTGNLNAAIREASDEYLKKAFIDRKYDVKNFTIMERRDRTPRETEITFTLSFQNPKKGLAAKALPTTSTENTVALIKEKGAWWIRDVVGKKTTIDFPVNDEDVIRPKE